MVIFTKKVELLSVKEKEVPFFRLEDVYNPDIKGYELKKSVVEDSTTAEIKEYRISYSVFGKVMYAYTVFLDTRDLLFHCKFRYSLCR